VGLTVEIVDPALQFLWVGQERLIGFGCDIDRNTGALVVPAGLA